MKRSTLLIFAVILFLFTGCSPAGYVFDGKKIPGVTISDIGDLYSTYNLSNQEKQQLGNQLKSQSLLNEIVTYSKESQWPDAVNSLEKRLKVRATMAKYNFYKVASIGNKTIVSVPAERNRHMPQGFVPSAPMYMIFASSVVISKK